MGSTWEPTRKRIPEPDSASIRYSLYEGVGRSAWLQKRSLLYVFLLFKLQASRPDMPDTSSTLCPQTALAWHPVHPILVSGGSEGAISTGTSPLRQQGLRQMFRLRHRHPPRQPRQHRTPYRCSQHLHHKSPLARRFPKRTTQTFGR